MDAVFPSIGQLIELESGKCFGVTLWFTALFYHVLGDVFPTRRKRLLWGLLAGHVTFVALYASLFPNGTIAAALSWRTLDLSEVSGAIITEDVAGEYDFFKAGKSTHKRLSPPALAMALADCDRGNPTRRKQVGRRFGVRFQNGDGSAVEQALYIRLLKGSVSPGDSSTLFFPRSPHPKRDSAEGFVMTCPRLVSLLLADSLTAQAHGP